MKIKLKAFESKLKGVKAAITVELDGLLWINGILIREGNNGNFVTFPSYKSGDEWRSYIMAKKEFSKAILENYQIGKTVEVGFSEPVMKQEEEEEFPF